MPARKALISNWNLIIIYSLDLIFFQISFNMLDCIALKWSITIEIQSIGYG